MSRINNREIIWVDVIEDVPEQGCNTTTIRIHEPLWNRESMLEWLEANGYRDIIDFRVVIGDRVTSWIAPELEWVWIQNMTDPYYLAPPLQD